MSNSTRSPSASVLKPLPWMAEWWTKQSFWPPSGVMKPKPLASLNHFTVPVVRISILLECVFCVVGVAERAVQTDPQLLVIIPHDGYVLAAIGGRHATRYKKRAPRMRRPLFQHRNVFAQSCVCRCTNITGTCQVRKTHFLRTHFLRRSGLSRRRDFSLLGHPVLPHSPEQPCQLAPSLHPSSTVFARFSRSMN